MTAPHWRRTLWLMVALQAAMSLSFSASGPFLPLYIAEMGIHPTSSVESWAGTITSINSLTAALLSPFWGALADRTGRKAMVVRSCIAASFFTALMGVSQNVWELFGVRATSGIFGGFSAAAMALVGTQVPDDQLGFSLGWMATGQLVGTLFGPLLGGLLADHLHDYRAVFFWTSGGTLLAALACVALVREGTGEASQLPLRRRPPLLKEFGRIVREPALLPLFLVIVLAQIAARAAQPIIPLFVQSLVGNSAWLSTAAGAALAVTGLGDVLASPWLGKRSDRLGYRRVVMISLIGTALFTFPQAVAHTIWVFLALRFGVGVFLGGIIPAASAWIGRLVPPERRGQAFGITASATFLGQFIGPLGGGFIAARFGFGAVFVVIGLLALANFVLVGGGLRTAAERPA